MREFWRWVILTLLLAVIFFAILGGSCVGTVVGLSLQIFGAYYLSKGVFINGIRRYRFSEDDFDKYPLWFRLTCSILLGINRQNIDEILSEANRWSDFLSLTPKVKRLAYEPLFGFILLFLGLLCQIVSPILRI